MMEQMRSEARVSQFGFQFFRGLQFLPCRRSAALGALSMDAAPQVYKKVKADPEDASAKQTAGLLTQAAILSSG